MIVLGIDGSLTCTGLAVIATDGVPGTEQVLDTGTVRTRPGDGDDTDRCETIALGCVALAKRYQVKLTGVEMPYVDPAKSIKVALRLEALKATVTRALKLAGFEVIPVMASSRAKALGVSGKLKRELAKPQVIAAVLSRYGLELTEDECDAIGVALAAVAKHRKQERNQVQLGLGIKAGRRRRRKVMDHADEA